MLPKVYFDMEALASNPDMDMSPPLLRGRMLVLLHGIFKNSPHTYAIALVPSREQGQAGGTLRVFASLREELDLLVQSLTTIPWVRDYVRLHYPLAVPEDFSGQWKAFRRYRIPTLKADRKQGEDYGKLRQRRLEAVRNNHLEYFILYSKSTQQKFTLAVQCEDGEAQKEECYPNSYGFASAQRLFYLPIVE